MHDDHDAVAASRIAESVPGSVRNVRLAGVGQWCAHRERSIGIVQLFTCACHSSDAGQVTRAHPARRVPVRVSDGSNRWGEVTLAVTPRRSVGEGCWTIVEADRRRRFCKRPLRFLQSREPTPLSRSAAQVSSASPVVPCCLRDGDEVQLMSSCGRGTLLATRWALGVHRAVGASDPTSRTTQGDQPWENSRRILARFRQRP